MRATRILYISRILLISPPRSPLLFPVTNWRLDHFLALLFRWRDKSKRRALLLFGHAGDLRKFDPAILKQVGELLPFESRALTWFYQVVKSNTPSSNSWSAGSRFTSSFCGAFVAWA